MSILLLILILVLLITGVAFIGPRITITLSARTNMIIVSAYTGILLLFAVITLLIPATALKSPGQPAASNNSMSQELATNIASGHFDPPQGVTKKEIAYQNSSKSIAVSGEMPGMVYVGVKGKDIPDNGSGLIEVYSYATSAMSYNGNSYPIAINPPEFILTDDFAPQLTVSPSKTKEVTIRQFDDTLTLRSLNDSNSPGYGLYTDAAVIILLPPGVNWTAVSAEPISTLLYNPAPTE